MDSTPLEMNIFLFDNTNRAVNVFEDIKMNSIFSKTNKLFQMKTFF